MLASLLREEAPSLEALNTPAHRACFLDASSAHGVDGLVRRELKSRGQRAAVPPDLAVALDERARRSSMIEAVRRHELARVLSAFQANGLVTLVLKGGALAYTHYPHAHLRPRADTDLLVRKRDVARAIPALEALGYARINSVSRDSVFRQASFDRYTGSVRHVIDLHWAISNRPLFADMLSFHELVRDAVAVPALVEGARAPGPVHALLLACIHRTAHHDNSDLLFWLYDIKLLANSLSSAEWDTFLETAVTKRIAAVCYAGLRRAADRVGCSPEAVARIGELASQPGREPLEPSAAYLGVVGSGFHSLKLDLEATRGAAAKLRWMAGHVFPDAQYMRSTYGATNSLTLANAYVRRAVQGLWRVARRTRLD